MRIGALTLATTLLVALAPAVVMATTDCRGGTASPDAAPELGEFEFLIGHFRVDLKRRQGDDWSPPRPQPALWTGRYALGGTAIYDEWFDTDPDIVPTTGRGANLRVYDGESKRWAMTWIHTSQADPTALAAEMRDGVLTMWQLYPDGPSWEATFEVLSPDRWMRTQYSLDENGKRTPQFQLIAERVACRPALAE